MLFTDAASDTQKTTSSKDSKTTPFYRRYFPSMDNRVPPIIAEQVGIRSSSPASKNITASGIFGIVEWAT
jgi:hypothetical protein